MEHMWSRLRMISRMTKEMHPSLQIDALSHALLYHGYISKKWLCKYFIIVHMIRHAKCPSM